jgi:phage terminase small subunit
MRADNDKPPTDSAPDHDKTPKKSKGARGPRKYLTKEEKTYCEAYAKNGGMGAEALFEAMPNTRAWTPQRRAERSYKLQKKDQIRARIAELVGRVQAIANNKFDISAARVLQELAAIAFANAEDYYRWGSIEQPVLTKKGDPVLNTEGQPLTEVVSFVHIRPSDELTRIQKAAIVGAEQSFTRTGDAVISVKMADKRAALRDLGQHLGLFKLGIEAGGKGGGPIQIVISSDDAAL